MPMERTYESREEKPAEHVKAQEEKGKKKSKLKGIVQRKLTWAKSGTS
jgi:hypothetical protein